MVKTPFGVLWNPTTAVAAYPPPAGPGRRVRRDGGSRVPQYTKRGFNHAALHARIDHRGPAAVVAVRGVRIPVRRQPDPPAAGRSTGGRGHPPPAGPTDGGL